MLPCAALALLAAGCGVTVERPAAGEKQWMSKSELRDYVEQVLRRQNAVQNELMFLLPALEESDPVRYGRMIEAEDRMMEACEPLISEVVERRRGGARDSSLSRLRRLPRETVACDRETRRVEELLKQRGSS